MHQEFPKANALNVGFSVKELNDYREQAKSLAQIEEYHQMSFILLDGKSRTKCVREWSLRTSLIYWASSHTSAGFLPPQMMCWALMRW